MARNFNGGTDRVAYAAEMETVGSLGCVAFWMKTTQVTANPIPLSMWTSGSINGLGFILNSTAGKIRVIGRAGTSTIRIDLTSTTTVNNGAWHHVLFNFNQANGGANALYINGVSEATGNSSASWAIQNTGSPPYLGDNNDAFWPSYVGDMAELALWNTGNLSVGEISALASGFAPPRVRVPHFYAPLRREVHSLCRAGGAGTATGGTVTDHPRIIG